MTQRNLNVWAVVIRDGDYAVRQLDDGELMPPDAIAYHTSEHSANLALDRVTSWHMRAMERLREPCERETALRQAMATVQDGDKYPDILNKYLTPSLECETTIRNSFLNGAIEIAQPRSNVT